MEKPRISIRIKFLSILSGLLFACIAFYLVLALHTFKQDKTELVFDLNRSLVSGVSNDIETSIRSTKDKLELFAMVTEGRSGRTHELISDLLKNDPNIVYIVATNRLVQSKNHEYVKSEYLQTYGLDQNYFSREVEKNFPAPIEEILKNGSAVWSFYQKDLPTLIGIGKAVIIEAADKTPLSEYAVVAYIKTDHLLQAGSHLKANQIFVTDKNGQLLLHSKQDELAHAKSSIDWPLVKLAKESSLSTQVLAFDDKEQKWMGAFTKTKDGELIVYAMIEETKAFAAVIAFIKRSILFASIAATFAFIAAVLFSRSLTRPLEILVNGMQKVTAGELQTRIVVKSNDETSLLAASFNKMIKELQDSRHQLEEVNRDLEYKVKERTVQLEDRNKAVKEAQEALLRTTRLASVGEIAARAAHEVLNPLTGMMTRLNIVQKRSQNIPDADNQLFKDILQAWISEYKAHGLAGLLRSWEKPSMIHSKISLFEEDLENLLSIQQSLQLRDQQVLDDTNFLLLESQRISKIVQNMRSLSQVNSHKEKHHLHELIEDSFKIMGDLFTQKNIQVSFQKNISDDEVLVDKDEFIQCMTNIFRNSYQAILQEKNAKIEVTTSYLDGKICIDICDTGAGILPEYQKNLFETQFTTKSKDEGTGLGLNISRRFIRAVDGDLFLLESIPNQKTIFRVTLPTYKSVRKGVAA